VPRFVVLLRGVNVGKANRVPMADFRSLLEAQGFTGVRTLLNSGNAVFDAVGGTPPAHAKAVRAALEEKLDVSVPVVVKPAAAALLGKQGLAFTTRNWATVLKLRELVG